MANNEAMNKIIARQFILRAYPEFIFDYAAAMVAAVFVNSHNVWPLLGRTLKSANNAQNWFVFVVLPRTAAMRMRTAANSQLYVLRYAVIGAAFDRRTYNRQPHRLIMNVTR